MTVIENGQDDPLDPNRIRRANFLNALLFEVPGGTRFTQDSPILPNIWIAYAENPRQQQELILNVEYQQNAGRAAHAIGKALTAYRNLRKGKDFFERERARISFVPGQIAAKLYFDELIRVVLPMTVWWTDVASRLSKAFKICEQRMLAWRAIKGREKPPFEPGEVSALRNRWKRFPDLRTPEDDALRRDLALALMLIREELLPPAYRKADDKNEIAREIDATRILLSCLPDDLIWMVGIGGLVSHCFVQRMKPFDGQDDVSPILERDFKARKPPGIESARTREARLADMLGFEGEAMEARLKVVGAFFTLFELWSREEAKNAKPYIYQINKNRHVQLAVAESALTVKADAARLLFNVDCSNITWAIIDSGIDAKHPAFRLATKKHELEKRRKLYEQQAIQAQNFDEDGLADELRVDDLDSRVIKTLDFTRLRELLDIDLGEHGETDPRDVQRTFRQRLAANIRARDSSISPKKVVSQLQRKSAEFREGIDEGRLFNWQEIEDFIVEPNPDQYPPDNDHGTHVAGILAADWIEDIETERNLPLSLRSRRLRGICPDINLIDVRVFRKDGLTDEFELMAAIQYLRWMNSRAGYWQVHGANLSVSLIHEVRRFACGRTPVCLECDEASASGMVMVVAAGNQGFEMANEDAITLADSYRTVSVTDPGNAQSVITVGSTHRRRPHEYGISYFSSRGPTGDGRIKPDVVAPGEKITAPVPGEQTATKDGTSMAAPHVSGIAAMLMSRHSELIGKPARIKEIICNTATDLGRERYFQGHGLVDALRALQSI